MHTTNYYDTFIAVAPDCPVVSAEAPPSRGTPSVAELQFAMIAEHPYRHTSDEVLFAVHARRADLADEELAEARQAFFSKGQPCLRSSPLPKRYGWGVHADAEGRVALVPLGSQEYLALAADPSVKQLLAMRSKRG